MVHFIQCHRNSKLYYYKARVYDPQSGRFLQTDPVGYGADMDLYAYAGEDPMNGSDPTGEAPLAFMKGGGDGSFSSDGWGAFGAGDCGVHGCSN